MSTVIISRAFRGETWQAELERRLIEALAAKGLAVVSVPNLYHLAERSEIWARLASATMGPVVVAGWIHERPTRWILARHRIVGDEMHCVNLAIATTVEAAVAKILPMVGDGGAPGIAEVLGDDPAFARWYPVLDKDRCTDCGHCLQFCLFGVYATVQGKVTAVHPQLCKSGCPACGRICPQSAIMFPLYRKDDAIAGAPGKFVQVDDAAKRLYEQRTGRPMQVAKPTEPPTLTPTQRPAFDDLDALVADMEAFTKGRR